MFSSDMVCFHSINVPSEWGQSDTDYIAEMDLQVSIQLMSPASGDLENLRATGLRL